jgi:hypothetical protein
LEWIDFWKENGPASVELVAKLTVGELFATMMSWPLPG